MSGDITIGAAERIAILTGSRQRNVAATGSTQTDAAIIGANVNIISGADGTKGVALRKPKGLTSKLTVYVALVYSSAATNALLVYPPVGGTINNGAVNAALSIAAQKPAIFWSVNGTDFIALVGS